MLEVGRLEAGPILLVVNFGLINMEKELYIVYFKSANYAGYGEHCLAWATSEDEAKNEASDWAEEFYYDQDNDTWEEDHCGECECEMWGSIEHAFPLASEKGKEFREYLADPTQKHFYHIVNKK